MKATQASHVLRLWAFYGFEPMYFLLHPLPHLSCPSAWSLEVHCHCLLFLCDLHSSRGSFIRRSHLQANYEPWPGSIMSQLNGYTDISTVIDEKGEAAHPHGGRKTKLVGRLRSCRRMNATTWLERSKGISCSAVLALASRTHARGVHGTTPSIAESASLATCYVQFGSTSTKCGTVGALLDVQTRQPTTRYLRLAH